MLLATPFLHIDKVLVKDGPPRIISEIKKPQVGVYREQSRPRLNGDLLVKYGSDQQWFPRRLTIRGGQLLVGAIHGETKYGSVKIPLRRLSLSAGKLPNSLSLIKGQSILLTIQTPSERIFDLWVKAIAIELIRQTPLEDVKYFDILTIDDSWKQKLIEKQRDHNFNCIIQTDAISNKLPEISNNTTHYNTLMNLENYHVQMIDVPSRSKRNNSCLKGSAPYTSQRSLVYPRSSEKLSVRARSRSCNSVTKEGSLQQDINTNYIDKTQIGVTFDDHKACGSNDEKSVETLLKKCQNHENYVPVKEKLLLFETLCRLGRKVRSTEDVYFKVDMVTKRARSLHDLHRVNSSGVRQICRYFEDKCDSQNYEKYECKTNDKRLIKSDSNLSNLQKFKSNKSIHMVSSYA